MTVWKQLQWTVLMIRKWPGPTLVSVPQTMEFAHQWQYFRYGGTIVLLSEVWINQKSTTELLPSKRLRPTKGKTCELMCWVSEESSSNLSGLFSSLIWLEIYLFVGVEVSWKRNDYTVSSSEQYNVWSTRDMLCTVCACSFLPPIVLRLHHQRKQRMILTSLSEE